MVCFDEQPPPAEEDFITQISINEGSLEIQSSPFEQTPADDSLVENVSTEYQSLQTTDVPVVKLKLVILEDELNIRSL